MIFKLCILLQLLGICYACNRLNLYSENIGDHSFFALSPSELKQGNFATSRAAYRTLGENPLYLFHVVANLLDGNGRWVVDHELGSVNSALAFVESWSVMPNLVHSVNQPSKRSWSVHNGESWINDLSLHIQCGFTDDNNSIFQDSTIYLDAPSNGWQLSGFFVEIAADPTEISSYNGPLFSRIGSDGDRQMYLFKMDGKWILGSVPGVMDGVAYVIDDAFLPSEIRTTEWYFTNGGDWQVGEGHVISSTDEANVHAMLRMHRSIRFIPDGQTTFELSNGLPMPSIGLGTGGIAGDQVEASITEAFKAGYRLIDSAREYGNERIINKVISEHLQEREIPLRNEVFIISKVWPTHLGFRETTEEVYSSLSELNTSYVDQYLLHWPECVKEWEWMHCETTINPDATWHQSWRALERAYAEGRVMSIGVSNFNLQTLQYLAYFANTMPHAVQNHATVGEVEMPVRIWCSDNAVVFTAYASIRNLHQLPDDLKTKVNEYAVKYDVSPQALVSRFMWQSFASIIPRSTKVEHLHELINIVNWQLTEAEMESLGWNVGSARNEL